MESAIKLPKGQSLVQRAMASAEVGPYVIQAAIAAVHATCGQSRSRPTGRRLWRFTMLLARAVPSPVVELNRAVAVAMRDGPADGLTS